MNKKQIFNQIYNFKMQIERQIQMQNQMRERQMAMQIARARDMFLWFGSFYAVAVSAMIAG